MIFARNKCTGKAQQLASEYYQRFQFLVRIKTNNKAKNIYEIGIVVGGRHHHSLVMITATGSDYEISHKAAKPQNPSMIV